MRDNPDIIQEAASKSSEPENEEPHFSVPEAPSPENTLEVNSPITPINDLDNSVGYTLPFRHIVASLHISILHILRKKDQDTRLLIMCLLRDYQNHSRSLCIGCPHTMFPA